MALWCIASYPYVTFAVHTACQAMDFESHAIAPSSANDTLATRPLVFYRVTPHLPVCLGGTTTIAGRNALTHQQARPRSSFEDVIDAFNFESRAFLVGAGSDI